MLIESCSRPCVGAVDSLIRGLLTLCADPARLLPMSEPAPSRHSLHSTADADVLVPIIMNYLGGKDLLRFQRCSRRMLQLADSPIAWKHSPLTATITIDIQSSRPLHCRFPRHASLSVLLVIAEHTPLIPSVLRALLQALQFGRPDARLHGFSTGGQCNIAPAYWLQLLALPSLSELRILRFDTKYGRERISAEVMEAIGRLTSLRCLALLGRPGAALSFLANCPHLHTLHLCDAFNEWHPDHGEPTLMSSLATWSAVRTLRIDAPRLHGA